MITLSPLLLTKNNAAIGDVVPDAPTLFSATDAENCQITCTWTDSTVGTPSPRYDIYEVGNTTPISTDVTSPAILSTTYGTATYYVKSYNYIGGADSNIDSGTGVDTRPSAFTLSGTTDENLQITFTWTEEASTTYDLYKLPILGSLTLVESSVTSPHIYSVNPEVYDKYQMVATNSCGTTTTALTDYLYSTEVLTLPEVITDGDYIYLTSLQSSSLGLSFFDRSNWHIIVDGVEDTSGSVYKLAGVGDTFRIGQFQYIYSGQTVTLSHDVQESTIAAFTAVTVTNNSTLINGVSVPPIYEMTEPLNQIGLYYYLDNSSSSGEIYDGRLEHSSQSSDGTDGEAWQPSLANYPLDGTINLSVNGNGTRKIGTNWIPPSDSEWTLSAVYDVVKNVSYSAYTLHYYYDAPSWVVDVYLWSSTVSVPLTPTYTGLAYTPPTTEWVIEETPPDIISPSDPTDIFSSFKATISDDGDGTFNYSTTGNSLDISTVSVTTNVWRPTVSINTSSQAILAKDWEFNFNAVLNSSSGSCVIRGVYGDQSGSHILDYVVLNGSNTVTIPTLFEDTGLLNMVMYFDGTTSFDVEITNFEIVEV